MRKKNSAVMIIIVVAALLILAIGVSFAYFINQIKIKNEGEPSRTKINTSTMASIEYTSNSNLGSNNITIENAYPGKFGYVEFTLTAVTKDDQATTYYQVLWNIDQNEFNYLDPTNGAICDNNNCEAQVYYALYDGKININKTPYTDPGGNNYEIFKGVVDGKVIEYNHQTIKNDITAKTGEIVLDVGSITATKNIPATKTYTLVVWFEETGHNQNNNQGKILNGKIDVKLNDKEFK